MIAAEPGRRPDARSPVVLILAVLFASIASTATAVAPTGMTLRTPLGDDVLVPVAAVGREALSQPFQFDVDLLADEAVDAGALLGRQVQLVVARPAGPPRTVSGRVASFTAAGVDGATGAWKYRMELVPALWFLTLRADLRIFQDMSVPEIVAAVLGADGGARRFGLEGVYPSQEYCVQYRESNLDFVSRLLEDEGIFYYFEQRSDGNRAIFGDSSAAWAPIGDPATLPFAPGDPTLVPDAVQTWENTKSVRPGEATLQDYDMRHPHQDLTVTHEVSHGLDRYEIYDYPGEYATREDGLQKVQARAEELAWPYEVVHGTSSAARLTPGHVFSLTGYPVADQAGPWLVVSVRHTVQAGPPPAPDEPPTAPVWTNTFTCIPASVPYRPPRVTPRPVVGGVETAVVTGPSGEEVYADGYGRVKVQFHWDREGEGDETSSCWLRVLQPYAGQAEGFLFLPRVGQEVVVAFEHGDPDRPVIVGRVYNGDDVPDPSHFRPKPGRR